MSKYTPGPWRATQRTVTAPETEDRLGLEVRVYGGNSDDHRANCRLIAAAPDLLEACQSLVSYCDENPPMGKSLWSIRLIRAAIAKATGETP